MTDIYSITNIRVGGAIPEPAHTQIATILGHRDQSYTYIRGRGPMKDLKTLTDYVLVWDSTAKKWGKSYILEVLQKKHLAGGSA